jgi:hypothetical protein
MSDGLTPRLMELVYEAMIRCFWRKKALAAFLRGSHISEATLATWMEGESKREFLDRLMPQVQSSPKGPALVNKMARHLAEMTTFPDLKGWEDADEKMRSAKEAVRDLKEYLGKKDQDARDERERRESRERVAAARASVARSTAALESLQARMTELHSRLGEQQAGYDFEVWFYDLLVFYEVECRRPYKTGGRQIDGSVTLLGTTYLGELKFTREQAGATDIDTFRAKITSKADNTMGIMVSISGYSSVAVQEASGARTPMLLLDHGHVFMALDGRMRLPDIIERLRRHASQTGEAYLPAGNMYR